MASAVSLIAAQAPARTRRRRTGPLPTTELPRAIEREYLRGVLKLLEPARALVEVEVLAELDRLVRLSNPQVGDSVVGVVADQSLGSTLARRVDGLRIEYARRVTPQAFADLARHAGWRTVDVNRLKAQRQFKALLGIDVIGNDPALAELVKDFAQQNVALIKTVSDRYFTEIETTVLQNTRSGARSDALAQQLRERFNVAESRAALIARDQTNKLNGDITRQRQVSLGITHYVWRTAKDDLVRPSHAALEGRLVSWKEPPVVDLRSGRRAHPGGDIQCRCTAEPIIEGVNDLPTPRIQPKTRATPPPLVPRGVPEGYAKQDMAPKGRFSIDRVRTAFPRGFEGKLTRAQQVALRRELNGAAAAEGLVERGILTRALSAEHEQITQELMTAVGARKAELQTRLRTLESFFTAPDIGAREASQIGTVSVTQHNSYAIRYRGAHDTVTGEMILAPDVARDLVAFARTPPAERTAEMVSAMRTAVHETMHGHSPMRYTLYNGVGVRVEEATNELAARAVTEGLAPGWKFATQDLGEKVVRGSYTAWVDALSQSVATQLEVTAEKASAYAREASLAMRRHAGPVFSDAESYAHHFARNLPGLRMKVATAERAAAAELDAEIATAKVAGRLERANDLESERHSRTLTAGAKITRHFVDGLLRALRAAPSP